MTAVNRKGKRYLKGTKNKQIIVENEKYKCYKRKVRRRNEKNTKPFAVL
jgi:hypothetical protein